MCKQQFFHRYISAGLALCPPKILLMMWRRSTITIKDTLITITAVGPLFSLIVTTCFTYFAIYIVN